MPNRRQGGRSYGQTRAYMDAITDRHTREILRARLHGNAPARPVDPERLAERKRMLEEEGLLSFLEKEIPCPVLLPGDKHGIATGLTPEGFVIVKGWDHPFNPKVLRKDKPSGT